MLLLFSESNIGRPLPIIITWSEDPRFCEGYVFLNVMN